MIVFPDEIFDSTNYDTIDTVEREAEEEIDLKLEHYSTLGCLPLITDSQAVMITSVVALLHSPKFVNFHLIFDEIKDAFYLDRK